MDFEFSTSNRIIFGEGKIHQTGEAVQKFGSSSLIIASQNTNLQPLLKSLADQDIRYHIERFNGEPTINGIIDFLERIQGLSMDMIIGIGGGSILDTGKAVSALRVNPGNVMDYLEVVGDNKPITVAPIPYIAIPTTSGTGSEVTRNAVLGVPDKKVKVSLRSPLMIPKMAIVDPTLSITMPPEVTASTGLDALAQVVEPFLSLKANPMTDMFCREGIKKARHSLRIAYSKGNNIEARIEMAWVSLLSGLALANSGLGAVHGFAGTIGGMFNAPHGMICACLLLIVFNINYASIRKEKPCSNVLKRFEEISRILCGSEKAKVEDGVCWLSDLVKELKVPGLARLGITEEDIPDIIEKSKNSSSMKANPVRLKPEEMSEILLSAL